jgi:hypothetical protein
MKRPPSLTESLCPIRAASCCRRRALPRTAPRLLASFADMRLGRDECCSLLYLVVFEIEPVLSCDHVIT